MLLRRLAYSFIIFILCASVLPAQETEKTDSLVRLLGCDELQQVEQFGYSFRKALGHARFEHNSTLLVCDTAIWNVNSNVIKAYGNVRIIQNETVLSSDKLDYLIDENLAKFRGTVVQLQDKQTNTLRTKDLDYNTKDSVATFKNGGAMRDKDGQVIESRMGSYESKFKTFIFTGDVNMYTDSVFVKTDRLEFNAEISKAYFGTGTNAWKDSGMLSSNAGWYDRDQELFLFYKNVHLMTPNQEAWSDSLKYYKLENNVEMFGNVELLDTTRNVSAVAGYMQYIDSLRYIRMTRDPAVIAISEQDGQIDTTYVGADTLVYWTVKMCDVNSGEKAKSEKRLEDINTDAVTAYRRNAYEKAKEAAEQTKRKMLEEDPNAFGGKDLGKMVGKDKSGMLLPAPFDEIQEYDFPEYSFAPDPPDSLISAPDSLAAADSLGASFPKDSSAVELDTTKVGFLLGMNNVKVFRKDMQVACDSLEYNDLDSLVRLYRQPVVWNEIDRQYSADSIFVVIRNRALEKASLMSEAFIVIKQDSVCFDQIKGTEMMAYFDSTGALSRFDSMGGSSGVFFIEENGTLATVNKFEAKMLTAVFKDGDIHDLNYFEEAKTDAYPLVQLQKDERILKGFQWQPENRPADPEAVTSYQMRRSEREKFSSVKRPEFKNTEIYFPGYMDSVHKMLATQDSLRRVRRLQAADSEPPLKPAPESALDSIPGAVNDSIPASDADPNLETSDAQPEEQTPDVSDENVAVAAADSSGAAVPSLKFTPSASHAADSLKAAKLKQKEEKAARKKAAAAEKAAAKEARWAEKDAKDAVKAEKKAARDLARKRKSTLEAVLARDKREAREQKIFERYQARYEKQKARRDSRHPDTEAVPSKKKEKAPDLLTPPEDKGIQSLGGKEKQIYVE